MLVLVLWLVGVENFIDLKELNALSESEKSYANIKVYQNLFKYLHYSRPARTIFRYKKKSYVMCLPWNKEIYKLIVYLFFPCNKGICYN